MSHTAYDGWYAESPDVQQGTLAFEVDVFIHADENPENADYRKVSAIVLTQSCDIGKRSQTSLLIAEVHDFMQFFNGGASFLKKTEYRNSLARGTSISDFLLPPHPGGLLNWSIVNFRSLYVVDASRFAAHQRTADSTICLASPYTEHLSQSFARFMMRVGLPSGLQDFADLEWGSWV